jgi:hypothetical protein
MQRSNLLLLIMLYTMASLVNPQCPLLWDHLQPDCWKRFCSDNSIVVPSFFFLRNFPSVIARSGYFPTDCFTFPSFNLPSPTCSVEMDFSGAVETINCPWKLIFRGGYCCEPHLENVSHFWKFHGNFERLHPANFIKLNPCHMYDTNIV